MVVLCGATSARHLKSYSLVISLGGIAVLGVGVWMVVDSSSFIHALQNLGLWGPAANSAEDIFKDAVRQVKNSAIVGITAGSLAIILGVVGCLDNYTRARLNLYALVLSAVIVMQIGAAVAFAKSAPTISATVETELNKLVGKYDYVHTRVGPRHRVTPVKNQFYDNSTVLATTLVNLIQAWVGCCGAVNGFTDYNHTAFWNKSANAVPIYCCKFKNWQRLELVDPSCAWVRTPMNSWLDTGCINKTQQLIADKFPVVTTTAVVVSLFDLGGVIFALGLAFSIGKAGYLEL